MKLFHIATPNDQYKTHYGVSYQLKDGEVFIDPPPSNSHVILDGKWVNADSLKTTSQLFTEEMAALNEGYQSDVDSLNMSFAKASLADGSNETNKKAVLRTRYTERTAQYQSDLASLKVKYGY